MTMVVIEYLLKIIGVYTVAYKTLEGVNVNPEKIGAVFRARDMGKSIQFFINVTKIILTRCQIFHLKCTKFNFGWGSAPDPARKAHIAPQIPSWIWGKGRE